MMTDRDDDIPRGATQDLVAAARQEAAEIAQSAERSSADLSMETPSGRGHTFTAPPPDSFTGYQIVREVHRGGQGVVYQAVQQSTSRRVAIKVLREGPFASEADRARFGREAEILGQLNHPSIVAIHDTGVAAGHHFLVMDYISGQPLDIYMANGERSVDETLRLFATICEAVNVAHLRGVIHRDLKPSNVRIDAEGMPHVLDFGLAKVPTTRLKGKDGRPTQAMTMTGQFIGSLPWAAPEQAEGVPSNIDIRTDVYSLGVILYQMLTAKFPYSVIGNMPDVLDRIMHAEPVRPSSVRRAINDEVETIVLKCLQKEPERRYQSAGELARDVRRYLTGEPIEAKRDSAWYVFRKSLRRHKLPIAIAASFVLLISASTVALSIMYASQSRARRGEAEQRQLAEANQAKAQQEAARAQQEAARARQEAAKARQAAGFIQQMLSGVDPEVAGSLDKTLMRMILDEAAAEIETELVGQPEVEASVRATIASTYQAIGEYALAQTHLEQALEIRQSVLGEEHPDTLASMNDLAVLCLHQGRYAEAEPLLVGVLEIRKRLLGEEHPDTLTPMNNLATLYSKQGRHTEAEPLLLRALETRQRVLGEEHPLTLLSMNSLATLYLGQGRYAEAEPLFIRVLEMNRRMLDEEHPYTLASMNNLASLYLKQHRFDQAEPLLVRGLETRKRVLGEEHPHTLNTMLTLGVLYNDQGRFGEAEPLLVRVLEINERVLGEEHPATLASMNNLAALYCQQGRYAEAQPLRVRLLEGCKRVLGEEHPNTLISMNNLGGLYATMGRLDEAEPLLAAAVDGARRSLREGHPRIGEFLTEYGACLTRLERHDEAETALLEAHQTLTAALGPAHKTTISSVRSLILLYEAWDKPDLAAEWQAKLDAARPTGPSKNGR